MTLLEKTGRALLVAVIVTMVAGLIIGTIIFYDLADDVGLWLSPIPLAITGGLLGLATHIARGGRILPRYRLAYRFQKWKRRFSPIV